MFTKVRWDKSFIFNSIGLRREWLSRLPQFLLAPYLLAPALAAACADQGDGLGQAVAISYARDGRWSDGSRLDAARGAAVPRAAVATTNAGVRKREQGRERRVVVS